MCQACEEGETVFIPYFGKPGGWRPPAMQPPAGAPAGDEAGPQADPPRFACDGPVPE